MENKETKIEYLRDIFLSLIGVLIVGIICLTVQNCKKITSEERIQVKTNEEIKMLESRLESKEKEIQKEINRYKTLKEDYCTNPTNTNYKELCKYY